MILFVCGCEPEVVYNSINEDANQYKNKGCIIFYPNNKRIEEYALNYCESDNEEVIDYSVEKVGDFIKVTYPKGDYFILNKDYSDIKLQIIDKKMLSELFIYEMKKSEKDVAYTSEFLKDNHYSNIDVNDFDVIFENDKVTIKSLKYDYSFDLDMGYTKQLLGVDFGIYKEYKKESFVSKKRPLVALTYDDGPYKPIDSELFSLFDLYDSRCTFFIVGNRMTDIEIENIKEGIRLGNEYGSHTQGHENIKKIKVETGFEIMMAPVNTFKENFDYQIKIYRQPYGYRNRDLEEELKNNGLISVLWNVDSLDWKTRDEESTYNQVLKDTDENDVVLMHSLYNSSLEASKRIVPELIDKGYQLVTVSELMNYLGVEEGPFLGK